MARDLKKDDKGRGARAGRAEDDTLMPAAAPGPGPAGLTGPAGAGTL
jgi:hypothetical protein